MGIGGGRDEVRMVELVIIVVGWCVYRGLLYYFIDFCLFYVYLKFFIILGVLVLGKLGIG